MKHLHIQNTDKFIEPYIDFINKHFPSTAHLFAVITPSKEQEFKTKYSNVHYINKNLASLLKLLKYMYKSEKIFLHSIFNTGVVLLLFLQPWLIKKCHWIVWGGDLYKYREPKITPKQKGYEFVRRFVIRNMHEILPIVKGDFNLAQQWYNTKARYRYDAVYVTNIEMINNHDFEDLHNNYDEIRLLVGNSASDTNNHEDIFEKLSGFKGEKIKLYVPLSYGGSKEYVERVISKGSELFGEKFVPLTDFMDKVDYLNLLSSMDAGIFNNDRQQAMGNIYLLLYLGKKVFIREDTSMWEELSNRYCVYSISQLENKSVDFLYKISTENRNNNIEEASLRYDADKVKAVWQRIFDE